MHNDEHAATYVCTFLYTTFMYMSTCMTANIEKPTQMRPVKRDSFTWNMPKPIASTAWSTVSVSTKKRYNI